MIYGGRSHPGPPSFCHWATVNSSAGSGPGRSSSRDAFQYLGTKICAKSETNPPAEVSIWVKGDEDHGSCPAGDRRPGGDRAVDGGVRRRHPAPVSADARGPVPGRGCRSHGLALLGPGYGELLGAGGAPGRLRLGEPQVGDAGKDRRDRDGTVLRPVSVLTDRKGA